MSHTFPVLLLLEWQTKLKVLLAVLLSPNDSFHNKRWSWGWIQNESEQFFLQCVSSLWRPSGLPPLFFPSYLSDVTPGKRWLDFPPTLGLLLTPCCGAWKWSLSPPSTLRDKYRAAAAVPLWWMPNYFGYTRTGNTRSNGLIMCSCVWSCTE